MCVNTVLSVLVSHAVCYMCNETYYGNVLLKWCYLKVIEDISIICGSNGKFIFNASVVLCAFWSIG